MAVAPQTQQQMEDNVRQERQNQVLFGKGLKGDNVYVKAQKTLRDKTAESFREFFNQYNKLTDRCFTDCIHDFTTRNVLNSENTCAMNCLEKYLKTTQRISERFREHQLLTTEDPNAALQGMQK